MSFIKTFDQVTKHTFDQTPVLLETFDQVIRSSEIRSSDPLSLQLLETILQLGNLINNKILHFYLL
jgi:hypothetical protein